MWEWAACFMSPLRAATLCSAMPVCHYLYISIATGCIHLTPIYDMTRGIIMHPRVTLWVHTRTVYPQEHIRQHI